jgi:dihydroflavonol-4-reductase
LTAIVAITGATGRIGRPLLDAVLASGRQVRALSRTRQPAEPGVEWVRGDLLDASAIAALVADADIVFHAAGQLSGTPADVERSLVDGTALVLDSAPRARIVHLSSLVVIDTGSSGSPRVIDEDSPLEPSPGRRGVYTRAKSAAEALARSAARRQHVVIVRPGLVVGGQAEGLPPSVGITVGRCTLLVGPSGSALPVVHARDVAAGLLCAAATLATGATLHLVDPAQVSRAALLRRIRRGAPGLMIPAGGAVQDAAGWLERNGRGRWADAAYRLCAAGKPHEWSCARAMGIGWRPVALTGWLAEGDGARS